MNKTIFISLPIEDLQSVIIDCVNSCLKNDKEQKFLQESEEKLLTIKQTAEFLNLSIPTIYSKVSRREIPFMKRGKRLYFSSLELTEYIKQGKVKSNSEIDAEANSYLLNSKSKKNDRR